VPAHAAPVLGGDFQIYKPGSTTITATLSTAASYVQWGASATPTGLSVLNGGVANYSDGTSGATVDLLGWTKSTGAADFDENGIGNSMALNLFAAWGGSVRPTIETAGSLVTIASGQSITITTMVGGPSTGPKSGSFFFDLYAGSTLVNPTSFIDQTLPLNKGFQMISRTYYAAALSGFIGQTTKIRIAIPDSNTIGNRIIFDDVNFTVIPEPSAELLGGLGLLALLRRRR
jgi:hypothetical protein